MWQMRGLSINSHTSRMFKPIGCVHISDICALKPDLELIVQQSVNQIAPSYTTPITILNYTF